MRSENFLFTYTSDDPLVVETQLVPITYDHLYDLIEAPSWVKPDTKRTQDDQRITFTGRKEGITSCSVKDCGHTLEDHKLQNVDSDNPYLACSE
jgi:hypothetical protein